MAFKVAAIHLAGWTLRELGARKAKQQTVLGHSTELSEVGATRLARWTLRELGPRKAKTGSYGTIRCRPPYP
eukprot:scaffold21991_cov33-Tisochrysis_lutea.AAC.5